MNTPHLAFGKALNRRHFLTGTGSALLGLPLLDAMRPAFSQDTVSHSPHRFIAMCATLGFHGPNLFPAMPGRDYELTPYLSKLKDHRDDFTLFSGLCHPNQQGNNGHASEMTWLTSAQRPGLAGFRNTISLDQQIARAVGTQTRYPYLALSTSDRSLSWTANGVPIPAESSPEKLFTALFVEGTPEQIEDQMKEVRRGRSILDTVMGDARRLEKKVGHRDRDKLEEYLTSVRDLEFRLQVSEDWIQRPKPKVEAEPPQDITDKLNAIGRQRLMNDMIVLALQTDSTRTITFQLSGMNAVPTLPGVNTDWHNLSHHGKEEEKIKELSIIEEAEFEAFAELLGKLKAIEENGKSLLDHTSILYGSNLGNASSHNWRNLPILVAGGRYRHGSYVAHDAEDNTPLANLFVTFAQRMGLETDHFGSSTSAGISGLELG
ncbi:MAG: DUF1552 domain-containing protein [Verrucomicrobiales bacterium]|nr:DUF1552 domain-containing protein [Verrucomicrobiales bacterium]